MFKRNAWSQLAILVLLLTASVWLLNVSFAGNEELYMKLDRGLFHLKKVYEIIARNYVDDVDPEGVSKAAINGIVGELDPYTVYFEKKGSERLEIITRGKYGGLGMEIGKRQGEITVISPIDNTPAQRAGLRAGDVITEIDGKSTEKMSLEEASSKLRGKVGTQVTIEIRRPGLDEPFELTLTREEIVLKDVSYADFIEPGTAFFRLTSFSDKAAAELKEAVRELQKEDQIDRVILDLRGNPGGLLASAVEVANIFIPKGELVVETRGAHENEAEFKTTERALLPTVPLVVLVNQGSASASEIVAGAVQDLDRGVIIGSPTFGKGLVQQVYPVDKINDAYIKITTAKYYVPSGRSIQKDDYKKNKDVFIDLSDSTEYDNHKNYYTRNGRVVHGGGGISPDLTVTEERTDHFVTTLWAKGYFFNFTVQYLAEHPALDSPKQFSISDSLLDNFRHYLTRQDLQFEIDGEKELKSFLNIAQDEKYSEDMVDLVEVALQKLEKEKTREFDKNLPEIKEALEAEFAAKLGNSAARIRSQLKYDNTLDKALEVLKHQTDYRKILAIKE